MSILYFVLGALWRRWFGGGFWDVSRFWKYLVLVLIVTSMYIETQFWLDWHYYCTVVFFMIFWAVSHGDYFYIYDTGKDEGRVKWIDWVLWKIYGEGNYYNFKGNVTGLLLRYTSTACIVAVCIPNAWFVLAGPLTVFAYIVTGKLKKPIVWAEFLSGALNFELLYLCLGG